MTAVACVMDPRPRVGVGVFVISKSHPGCVLLGKRRGSAGAGSWALPGGHLEFGEDWALCAEREVFEETGLRLSQVRCTAVLNAVVTEQSYHYLVILMRGEANGEPQNLEPDKCEGWSWCSWAAPLPEPLFTSLAIARARGVSPFVEGASVLETEELPRYCCVILEEESDITGTAWLLEGRPPDAAVAAGQLTCFGGKREPGEEPQSRRPAFYGNARRSLAGNLWPSPALLTSMSTASSSPGSIRPRHRHAACRSH